MALTLPKTVRHRMKGRSLDEDGDDEDHHDHLDQGCFGATTIATMQRATTMFDSRRDPCVQEKIFIVLQ